MDASPLGYLGCLPTELIFRILDCMDPREYSGLSCTCQRALALTNQKLDTPEAMEGIWRTTYNWKSRTGELVTMRGITFAPATVIEPHMESCINGSRLPDGFSDPDL
jgi:hypothetical protein